MYRGTGRLVRGVWCPMTPDTDTSPRRYVTPYRLALVRDGAAVPMPARPLIGSSAEWADLLRRYLQPDTLDREYFVVALLDGRHRPIALHTVSVGSLSAALVHPREVFKPAIVANAAAIIAGHNHPSGDETPSREDKELTARLAACGKLLGIPLLDHVVLGADRHFSFADHRLIDHTAGGTP